MVPLVAKDGSHSTVFSLLQFPFSVYTLEEPSASASVGSTNFGILKFNTLESLTDREDWDLQVLSQRDMGMFQHVTTITMERGISTLRGFTTFISLHSTHTHTHTELVFVFFHFWKKFWITVRFLMWIFLDWHQVSLRQHVILCVATSLPCYSQLLCARLFFPSSGILTVD